MKLKTYPAMDAKIKNLLRAKGDYASQYAAARIEHLENVVEAQRIAFATLTKKDGDLQ